MYGPVILAVLLTSLVTYTSRVAAQCTADGCSEPSADTEMWAMQQDSLALLIKTNAADIKLQLQNVQNQLVQLHQQLAFKTSQLQTSVNNISYQLDSGTALCGTAPNCVIDMQSWGQDDNTPLHGFIHLNGYENVAYTLRGVTVVVLDPVQCIGKNIRHFDTYASIVEATDLNNFLNIQPAKTILLAVTADDASTSAAPAYDAVRALTGSTISDVGLRGKYAFIAEVGSPAKSIFAKSGRYGSALRVKATVQYSSETVFTFKVSTV